MTIQKLSTGNYKGHHEGHYFFAYRRPHGKWCCRIGKKGIWLYQEGYHGSNLPTISMVKAWVRLTIANPPDWLKQFA
jgi:hypothetical protein